MILEEKTEPADDLDENPSPAEKVKSAISEYLRLGEHPERVGPVEFVKRLETIVDHVKCLHGRKSLYKINNRMENEATNTLKELEFLVKEMRAVMTNICRLRSNKIDFQKEISSLKGTIEKKSKEEIQEMETIVAVYDKDLLKKWHVAKKTSVPSSLENFIANLSGKKQAIEHVYKLALDRLETLKKTKQDPPAPPMFHLRFSGPNVTTNMNDNDTGSDTDNDEQFSLC